MNVHILTDNRAKRRGILAEHGLSLLIEHEGMNILFDTGQTDVYLRNAEQMGVDLAGADCIVLSHGHYDHCGGLVHFPGLGRGPKIYAHEAAFERKYARTPEGTGYLAVGIPWSLEEHGEIKRNLIRTKRNTQIAPGVHLRGEIPGTADFEGSPRGFYRGEAYGRDLIRDEQMLICEGEKGLSLFLGCSHPGVVNCLNDALACFPGQKIHSLVAGMHLDGADPERLDRTIEYMLELDIPQVVPLHCTGIFAICEMKRRLQDRCLPLCAGDRLQW